MNSNETGRIKNLTTDLEERKKRHKTPGSRKKSSELKKTARDADVGCLEGVRRTTRRRIVREGENTNLRVPLSVIKKYGGNGNRSSKKKYEEN